MAVRSPTGYSLIQTPNIQTAKPVLASEPDLIVDNQEFQLLGEQLGLSVNFEAVSVVGLAAETRANFYLKLIDFCDIAAITNDETSAKVTALVWSDGTATPQITVTSNAVTNNTFSHNGSITTIPHWTDWTHAAFNVLTNGVEDTIKLEIGGDPLGSYGTVWCAGLGLFVESAV